MDELNQAKLSSQTLDEIIRTMDAFIVQRDIKQERKNARQRLAQNGAFFVLGILASIIIGN